MKTLFLFLAFPFAFFLSPETSFLESNEPTDIKKIEVEVELDFGRAKKNCRGFGICGVVISSGKGIRDGFTSRATLRAENGIATSITFHKDSMSKKTMKKYFSSKGFITEEGWEIILKHKGEKILMNLKAGEYEIKKTKTGFNIGMPPN